MELPSFEDCPLPMVVARNLPKGSTTVKQAVALTSANVVAGGLLGGTPVTIKDILPFGDGCMKRALVTVDGGKFKGKEGWMTMVDAKEREFLVYPPRGVIAYARELPADALAAARAAFNVFDVDGSGALSIDELRGVLTRPGSDGAAGLSDAEVAEIIATFDADNNGELSFEEFAVMWAPSQLEADAGPSSTEVQSGSKSTSPSGQRGGSGAMNAQRSGMRSNAANKKAVSVSDVDAAYACAPNLTVTPAGEGERPGLRRQSTSGRLSALTSTSFAKKVKAAHGNFSFKKRGSAILNKAKATVLGGRRPSVERGEGGDESVLFAAENSEAGLKAGGDDFLSALTRAEERDVAQLSQRKTQQPREQAIQPLGRNVKGSSSKEGGAREPHDRTPARRRSDTRVALSP